MTEFELIARFVRSAPRGGEGVRLGIGDDAAVLRPPMGDEELVATVDAVVEGVHFDRRYRPEEIGWKSLAVNLSDLASMGARPLWALCSLATPPSEERARLLGVGRGLARCAREFGVALVGGNVTRARELALHVTVIGAVARGRALLRTGARPGDLILVSGSLGDAALGLAQGAPPSLVRRQRRPSPRLQLGRALVGIAHAAMDVSDGLLQDLGHLCSRSGVGASIQVDALPLSTAARRSGSLGRALQAALAGGEDYELLVAVAPAQVVRARSAARKVRVPLTVIGAVTEEAGVQLLGADGRPYPFRARGFDHLRPPSRRRRLDFPGSNP